MDNASTGCRPFRILALCAISSIIGIGLNACVQHPAGAQSTQREDRMQGQPPTRADIVAEQDRAAVAADDAARATKANEAPPSESQADYPALPAGPALTASHISSGIVKLAASLNRPEDTEVASVSEALGIALSLDVGRLRAGAKGGLGTGGYEVAVWKPNSQQIGQLIEFRFEPRERSECPVAYKRLQDQLVAAGYLPKPAPRFVKPRVYFQRVVSPLTAYVTIDTDQHDDPICAWVVSLQLEANDGQ